MSYKAGDIVLIKPEWLDKGEDPKRQYIIMEDQYDNNIKVCIYNKWGGLAGVHTWDADWVTKIGHLDFKKKRPQEGDLYGGSDGVTFVIEEVNPDRNQCTVVFMSPEAHKDQVLTVSIEQIQSCGYDFIKSMKEGE